MGVCYTFLCESTYTCVMLVLTSRVKENEGESNVFYYKVDRQMKEVGEIVLSVRIRPCVYMWVCGQIGSP